MSRQGQKGGGASASPSRRRSHKMLIALAREGAIRRYAALVLELGQLLAAFPELRPATTARTTPEAAPQTPQATIEVQRRQWTAAARRAQSRRLRAFHKGKRRASAGGGK